MTDESKFSRRTGLKGAGALGAAALCGAPTTPARAAGWSIGGSAERSDAYGLIRERVWTTPFVDTHEHLIDEEDRLTGTAHFRVQCDDWTILFTQYLESDLRTSGMPEEAFGRLFSPNIDPLDKWPVLEPYWPAVKNTGYGQATAIAIRELYGVEELSAGSIGRVQEGYEKTRRKGFYHSILRDQARIESCQVNCLSRPFLETSDPTFLMQDLSIVGMFAHLPSPEFSDITGIEVGSLADWGSVMDWWFEKYGEYAVAVKSQHAYNRDIDYVRTPASEVEGFFVKQMKGEPLAPAEQKALEDHLFWEAVDRATAHGLPVKLHTGYYAGSGYMRLGRLIDNAGSACELCQASPNTPFVFMHTCYPYYEELIAVAKHYANAYVDMCWAWIINPVAARDFLKKYLVTAPANKILTFGGDFIPVEPVLGHAVIARQGITQALAELVDEGWMSLDSALELIDPILRGNARRIFRLAAKTESLKQVPWG